MNSRINIQPVPYVYPVRIVHHLEIQIINIVLFSSATIMVSMYDENGSIIENRCFSLNTEQYVLWDNNDETLVNLVLNILGYTRL